MNTYTYCSGVLDKKTNDYVNIHQAKRKIFYSCLDCKSDVILRAGLKNKKHFAHHNSNSNCTFYENHGNYPGESKMHKDAKYRIESIINKNKTLKINKECNECCEIKTTLIKNTGNIKAVQEYKFVFNNSNKSADVAILKNNKLDSIIEIFHTHATNEQDRPEPWFELSAFDVLEKTETEKENYELKCSRMFICKSCIEDQEEILRLNAIREKESYEYQQKKHLRYLALQKKQRDEQVNKDLETSIKDIQEKEKQDKIDKLKEIKRREEEAERINNWNIEEEERKEKERIKEEERKELFTKLNFNFENNQLEHIINNKISCELISKKNTLIMFYDDEEVVFSSIRDKEQYIKYWNKLKKDSQIENYIGHYTPFTYRIFNCKIEKLNNKIMYDLVNKYANLH